MCGRAGALSAGLAAAYAGGAPGPRDLVAVVHAHQAVAPQFFERALPALAGSTRTVLVRGRPKWPRHCQKSRDAVSATSRRPPGEDGVVCLA